MPGGKVGGRNFIALSTVSFLMIGIARSKEREREGHFARFAKNFVKALLECSLEVEDFLPYAVLFLVVGFGLYLVAGMIDHLMFDPSASDVASRLDLLSIDPDKWISRS